MNIQFKYAGQSGIVSGLRASHVAFATNGLREAVYFRGRLGRPLVARDALASLYDIARNDLSYRPRDRVAFRAWLAEQDRAFVRSLPALSAHLRDEIEAREARLAQLDEQRKTLEAPFHAARRRYFEYAVSRAYELEYVLDPVVTVHPDELSFEAFSRDESAYGRVALKYDLFAEIQEFSCGTTNVDFSPALRRQFERMRSYRDTVVDIGAGGVRVDSADEVHHEKQVALPESWLNGFLQVQSAMTLGLTHVQLDPIDLYNLCRLLSRRKAKSSPRALRWELEPGQPARVVFEPWEETLQLSPASAFAGDKPQRIRTWGRQRLRVLERLLPAVERVDVYLAGHGLPSFYVCDLGDVSVTLGLSGWTDQDWSGTARFDLLARRLDATADELSRVYEALREKRFGVDQELAAVCSLSIEKTRAALSMLCQVGRAMYDLRNGTYRHRDLLHAPFSATAALASAQEAEQAAQPAAKAARVIYEAGLARFTSRRPSRGGYKLSGSVRGTDGERVRPQFTIDAEGKILDATCTCRHFRTHRLVQGPCEHMLALRLAHMSRLEAEAAAPASGTPQGTMKEGGQPD
ncbi:MAG: SWIM zinc finger family protein [Polyangiales bacterium]